MSNIEKLMQLNAELSEKVNLYKESLVKMNGVLFIIDYDPIGLSWAGENFKEITGYKPEDLVNLGMNGIKALYHPDDFHFFKEGHDYFTNPETKDKSHTAVFRIKHKKGHYIWLYNSSFIISRKADGTPEKAGGILINLEKFMIPAYFEKPLMELEKKEKKKPFRGLSKREKEILNYISKGFSAAEVAMKINRSKRTVESHKMNIQKKLGMNNTAAVIAYTQGGGL